MPNNDLLERIIPRDVFWKIAEPWMWQTPLNTEEEALIEKAVDKRKSEFRAGRHCAHALFNAQGIACNALLKGVQREPAWPQGWVGSISHTKGLCVVAIAPKSRYQSIGLDVEQATPLSADVLDLICNPQEQDRLNAIKFRHGNEFASAPLDKVIFSAKESIHKTYFPLNHHTLDFLDAQIALEASEGTFEAIIVNPEPRPRTCIDRLSGRFSINRDFVASCIVLEQQG